MCHVNCNVISLMVQTLIFPKAPKDVEVKHVWATGHCFGTNAFANIGLMTCLKKISGVADLGRGNRTKNSKTAIIFAVW